METWGKGDGRPREKRETFNAKNANVLLEGQLVEGKHIMGKEQKENFVRGKEP